MPYARIGVIGGTGLYDIEGMTNISEVNIDTPFGEPSDSITVGKLEGAGVAFLPRHGKSHNIPPHQVPSLANIYAMKTLGVEFIIASNSCGSFKEEIEPGHLVIPDQVIDRTTSRANSFFEDGIVAHIAFADPFCQTLSKILYQAAKDVGATVHPKGTFIAMEGPAFSTRAESKLYRSWGADIIGMTVFPEAKLAREAEICYASIGCVTDYDAWIDRLEPVIFDVILSGMRKNIDNTKEIIRLVVSRIPHKRTCACENALKDAIATSPFAIPMEQKKKLQLIIGKYV